MTPTVSPPGLSPRSARARERLLATAADILARDGFEAMTMEAVAAAAGSSKATLYHHWSSKAALTMDAFLAELETVAPSPSPSPASVPEDLREQFRATARAFSRGRSHRMLAGVISVLLSNPDLQDAFRGRYAEPRRATLRTALRRDIERGRMRPDLDIEAFLDGLYGSLYLRLLTGRTLSEADADAAVDQALRGAVIRPPASS